MNRTVITGIIIAAVMGAAAHAQTLRDSGVGASSAAPRAPREGGDDTLLPLVADPLERDATDDFAGLIISGVDIEGLRNVRHGSVKSAIKVRKGDPYDQDRINADFKALLDTGYFDDVMPVFDPTSRTLVYRVVEKAQIRQVEFRGNVKVKSGKFKDDLPLKKDEWFDEVKLRDSINKILAKYDELGYSDTTVEYEQITDDANKMHLVFLITEGKRVTVASKPAVYGTKYFSAGKVRSVMETKRKKVYRESVLREDMDRILTLYRNAGFYDAVITTWTVVRDDPRQSVEVSVSLREGPRYRVRSVGVRGNTVFSDRQLMKHVVLRRGAVYNQRHVDESRMFIAEQYADRGYIKLRIDPDIVKSPAEGLIDVVFAIVEGDLVYVDRIYVTGMKATRENVIRREVLLREGDVFSASRLRRSQERIMNLGFMDDVRIDLQPGGAEDRMDLEFAVVEGRPGMLSAGAGYSSVDQLVGNLQVSHMNLFGKAQRLKLLWEFGARRQNYDISWTEPWFMDKPMSLGVSLYDLLRVVEFDGDSNAYKKKQQGLELKLGPRFGDKLGTLFSYSYENVVISDSRRDPAYDPSIPPERQVLNGAKLTSSISGQFIYDSRDNVFDPSRGMRHSVSCQLAGWGPLGGDVSFYKPIIKSGIHIPTVWRLVLSLNLQFGYIEGIGGFDLNTVKYQKFYVGGPDTVRGYRYSEVNPSDGGRIMTVFNAEYKFPIVMEQRRTVLQGALFYDMGGAWNEWRDMTTVLEPGDVWIARSGWDNRMKQAVGFGLRFTTPVFPVRLDWAWPVNPRDGDTYQFWFTIGQLF